MLDKQALQFCTALTLVFSDGPGETVDGIFFHAMSFGDDDEMFPLAASLLNSGQAEAVVINGFDGETLNDKTPGKASTGKDDYISRLMAEGVDRTQIILSEPAYYTRQACDAYAKVAKQLGWKSAITLNQPQQLLRATLGQIKVMSKPEQNYPMRVYATCPRPWDSQKIVSGNQGASKGARFDLIASELERILTYQDKGHLASFEEFFAYMAERSGIH